MVLIDSRAWIAFLYGKSPFKRVVADLSLSDRVIGHEFVYGELLMGDVRGGRAQLLADYRELAYAKTIPHQEVESLVRSRRLSGHGLGWVDAHLVASAMAERAWLYTTDAHLRAVAEELGILYLG